MAYGVLSTSVLDFGDAPVGAAPKSLTFTLTNAARFGPPLTGYVELDGAALGTLGYQDDLSLAGGRPSQPFSLAHGQSQTFTVDLTALHAEAFWNPAINPLKMVQVNYDNDFVGGMRVKDQFIGIHGNVLGPAEPWFVLDSGPGTVLSTGMNRFVLNLGDVVQGSAAQTTDFGIKNWSPAPADPITSALVGPIPDFTLAVPATVNIAAEQTEHGWGVTPQTGGALGYHDDALSLTTARGVQFTLVVQDHIIA